MQGKNLFGAHVQVRRRAARVRSTAWLKSLALASGAFLMAVSCSTNNEALTLPSSGAVKNSSSNSDSEKQPTAATLSLDLAPVDLNNSGLSLLKGFSHLSFVSPELLAGSSASGVGTLSLANGKFGTPVPFPVPAFASGKAFLPLRQDGAEFWLIESPEGKTQIVRNIELASGPLAQALPQHVKLVLDSPSSLLGFGKNFVLLNGSNSVWVVEFSGGKLKASAVPFPNTAFQPISGGSLSGAERAYWISESKALWTLTAGSDDWKAKKYNLMSKNASMSLEKLAAVMDISEGTPKLSGAAVALINSNIHIAGVSAPLTPSVQPSPVASVSPTPNVGSMNFAEAGALCNGCHASTSSNAAAKAKLTGTENISTWMNRKEAIINSVRDDVMPIGARMMEPNKTRFINFAQDPKP